MNRRQKLSPHFTLGELTRSCTAARKGIDNTPSPEVVEALARLCHEILEPIRLHFGIPFSPNSGYRSPQLNREIGGSPNSQHCRGEAVDIELLGVSNYDLASWIQENLKFDQLILECYQPGEPSSGWVHVSIRPEPGDNRGIALTYSNRSYSNGLVA